MSPARPPWVLLRWVGLTALFVAVATDTWLRPALTVSGVLWSLLATAALYHEMGGSWKSLAVAVAGFLVVLLAFFVWACR